MAKCVTWYRVQVLGKQDRHFIVLFWTVILFNRLNVEMFFLFACLSYCKYILFPCVSDTWLEIFFPHSWPIEGKLSCATNSTIVAEKNWNYFSPTAKIKIREKFYPCFWDKTANIWRRKNIPVYGIRLGQKFWLWGDLSMNVHFSYINVHLFT